MEKCTNKNTIKLFIFYQTIIAEVYYLLVDIHLLFVYFLTITNR